MNHKLDQYTDKVLISLLIEDSQDALVCLYYRYWDKLFVVSSNLTGSEEDAEECVQNVFISLWRRRRNLQLTHSLNTYLTVCIKYQSLNFISASKKRRTIFDCEKHQDHPHFLDPETEYILKELSVLIEGSINKLPEQCQIVFRKSKEHGQSVKQIAEELNISPNTVKMHLKIATRKLKNDLLIILPFLLTIINR